MSRGLGDVYKRQKEIADILQIGLPLVKYRHKRAKEELKRLLGEEDPHEPGKDDGNI